MLHDPAFVLDLDLARHDNGTGKRRLRDPGADARDQKYQRGNAKQDRPAKRDVGHDPAILPMLRAMSPEFRTVSRRTVSRGPKAIIVPAFSTRRCSHCCNAAGR